MLALLLLALAASAPAGAERVDVRPFDFESPALERSLERELDAALALFERSTGARLPDGERIVIRLFARMEVYDEEVERAGARAFQGNGAVTTWGDHESYVTVFPRTEPGFLRLVDHLPERTLQLALHEAFHQFAWKAGLYPPRYLPFWYLEGKAEWMAQRAMTGGDRGRIADVLCLADAFGEAERDRELGRSFPLDAVFGGEGVETVRGHRGYNLSQCLVGFLSDPANEPWHESFVEFEEELHRLGRPGGGSDRDVEIRRIDALWREHAGDLDELERAFLAEGVRREGDWIEVWGSSQWVDGKTLVSATNSWEQNSLVVHRAMPASFDAELTCELAIEPMGSRQADVVIARSPRTSDQVKLAVQGDGLVTLLGYHGGQWTALARERAPEYDPAARWHALRVRLDRGELLVEIDGETALEATIPEPYRLAGAEWGLGTFRSVARFRGIECAAR